MGAELVDENDALRPLGRLPALEKDAQELYTLTSVGQRTEKHFTVDKTVFRELESNVQRIRLAALESRFEGFLEELLVLTRDRVDQSLSYHTIRSKKMADPSVTLSNNPVSIEEKPEVWQRICQKAHAFEALRNSLFAVLSSGSHTASRESGFECCNRNATVNAEEVPQERAFEEVLAGGIVLLS